MDIRIPILTYHSIDNSGSVISTSPTKFESQMKYLHDKHFNVISLNKIVKCIYERQTFPPKSVVITFDDGVKNFYSTAYPVLKEYGFTATVFLVPGYCGRNNQWDGQPKEIPVMDLLNWEEIREMADNSIDFGAHTMNHANLSRLLADQAREEIVNSKQVIQKYLKKDVLLFAYPYGRLTNEIKDIVKNNFSGACSVKLDFVSLKSDIYTLPRIDMYYFSKNNIFEYIDTPIFYIYIVFRSILRSIRNKSTVVNKLQLTHND
ncbi:MAG: polysaccharide deacetylase family protein [Sedimentisphaerales bacterium]|nr:polysaccharide deacetylase family protein [Sedimentisphaerales bacterium]